MKSIPCLALIFLPVLLYCQPLSVTVKGKVTDQESKAALPGATIFLIGSNPPVGAFTDLNGDFRMEVPVGHQAFRISFLGYENKIIPDVPVNSGKDTELAVEMVESFSKLNEVVIKAEADMTAAINSMAGVSARQLRTDDARRYAAGFYDPSRMVSSFAGVGAVEGDGLNSIVIRGNSPRGLLWKLEGIEIPDPNHFPDGQGDSGGAFSIISSSNLSNFDFYTGAFPAEYGNACSGIMDVGLRKGNADKREYSFLFGVVGTQLTAEGPFDKGYGGSYLLSYRYSNFGLLNRAGLLGLAKNHLPPLFQDINYNISLPTRKAGNFELFGIAGNSWTGWDPLSDTSQWAEQDDRKEERENHIMGVIGLKHVYTLPGNRTFLKTVIAYSFQDDAFNTSYRLDDLKMQNTFKSDYSGSALRIAVTLNHKLSSRQTLRAGIIAGNMKENMYERKYDADSSVYKTPIDQTAGTALLQGFLQWKVRITEKLELNSGIHSMYFALNNDHSIEPRLGIKWTLNPKQSISAGLGVHTRMEALPAYLAMVQDETGKTGDFNHTLKFTRSLQSVVGYDNNLNENLRLKIEAYYQYLYDIPVVDSLNSFTSAINSSYGIPEVRMKNKGKGYNYGIEVTLEKFYSDNYYCLITLSLFDSRYKVNGSSWYNTAFNNRYITNFLLGKDFLLGSGKQNSLGINIKTLIRGGYRYTPIDQKKSAAYGETMYDDGQAFSEQYPLFWRIDFGINYRQNAKKFNWILSLDILNILNHENTLDYKLAYNERTGQYGIEPVKSLGIVPNLNWKIEF